MLNMAEDAVPEGSGADEDAIPAGFDTDEPTAADRLTLFSEVYRLISGDGDDSAQLWPPRRPAWLGFPSPMLHQTLRRPVSQSAEPTRQETIVVGQGPYLELYSAGLRDRLQQNFR